MDQQDKRETSRQEDWNCVKCRTVNNGNSKNCSNCHSVGLDSGLDQELVPNISSGFARSMLKEIKRVTHGSVDNATGSTPQLTSELEGDDSLAECFASDAPELRIVLLGRTGVGKSESGNTILGKVFFKSSASSKSVTKECQLGTLKRFGRNLQVIDVPGMFDTEMADKHVTLETIRCLALTAPGPHVFVIVLKLERFTEEIHQSVQKYLNIFGDGMLKHSVLLFTRKDEGGIEKYLNGDVQTNLKDLLEACNGRYVHFNNKGETDDKEGDVKRLLKTIDKMVLDNGGIYRNELYDRIEGILQIEDERERYKYLEDERQLGSMKKEHVQLPDDNESKESGMRVDTNSANRPDLKMLQNERAKPEEKVDFRAKTRRKLCESADLIKEKIIPILWEYFKKAVPILLTFGFSLIVNLV